MAKHELKLTYTFINPNTSKEFERQLRKILVDKLLSLHKERPVSAV